MSNFKKGIGPLNEAPLPELGANHDDRFSEMHEFAVRAFTWRSEEHTSELQSH